MGAVLGAFLMGPLGCSGGMQNVSTCQSNEQCGNGQICRASDGQCVPEPEYVEVSIIKIGDGSGTVRSTPAGIDCGPTCSGKFEVGSQLTLSATPASGSSVASFSVGCNSATATCSFTPQAPVDKTNKTPITVRVYFAATGTPPPAPLCNATQFCWENPKPTGNRLNDAVVVAPGEVWAVGDAGTILHRSGNAYTLAASGTTRNLYGIWANGNELYVVGEAGTILHGINGVFTSDNNTGITADLNDVWGSGATVIAVGASGVVLRRGANWSVDYTASAELKGVWGANVNDIWAVGAQGTTLHNNGTGWSPAMPTIFGGNTLYAVAGGSGVVYTADSAGAIYSLSSGVWSTSRPRNLYDDLSGLAVISGTPFAAGSSSSVGARLGNVWRLSGGNWQSEVTAPLGFRNIAGSSTSDLWAVGEAGTIWQSDGTPWQPRSFGSTQMLKSVWAVDSQHAWAVGGSTVLSYNGSYFTTQNASSPRALNAVWASSANDIWLVGDGGTILHYDGTDFVSYTSGLSDNLNAVYGISSLRAWAVGDKGAAVAWDGTSWTRMSTGTNANLRAVFGLSASEVWAAGDSGQVLRGGGLSLGPVGTAPATTANISGIWGFGANDIWMVADTTIFRYQGSGFSPITPNPAVQGLTSIWGSSATDMYATAKGGVLLSNSSGSFTRVPTGTANDLFAVMASQGKLWVVGSIGTILRRGP